MNGVRRRMGEYFFVKKRSVTSNGETRLAKFRPEDAADAFDASWSALQRCLAANPAKPTVIITHHAPSRQGINPAFAGNGLDGAYASDLDATIAAFDNVPIWVHGHTHIRKSYAIGVQFGGHADDTMPRTACSAALLLMQRRLWSSKRVKAHHRFRL